ncbi:unnamed protein product [Caenorhabditis nigoni]
MSAASIDVSDVIKYISDRIGDYDKPESLAAWCKKAMKEYSTRSLKCMQTGVQNHLNRIGKLEGYSLTEKLQLVFIFSRPVSGEFVQMLKDAKFQISQDSKKRISRFSTEDGSIVRFSDHHPAVKYFQGVLCLNNSLQKAANKDRMAREKEQGQHDVEYDNTSSEITEGPEPMEEKQEEIDAEVIEDPTEDFPVELRPKQEVDDYIDFGGDFRQGAFNGRINYEELDAQEFVYPGFPKELKPETFVRLQKRRQSSPTDNGNRVKTSNSIATSSNQKTPTTSSKAPKQPPSQEATPAIPTPDEHKISVLALATHIESIAAYYDLKNLQKKASLAMEKMNKTGDKTLSIKKFNLSISFMLLCLEENRIFGAENSITLKSLFKQLQISPVSDGFVQMLKDAKFEIEQDERNRICRFSTEDRSIVRFSDHHPNVKYFEGVLCLNSNLQKNANKERIEREKEHGQQDLSYEIPSSEVLLITEQPVESIPIEPKREEIDEEVKKEPVEDNLIEKKPKQETDDYIDFGVDAGQAFNGRINYEELDAQKFFFPGFPEELKPETSIGSQKKHQNSTTDSEKRVKIEEMESGALSADSIATSSDKKQQSSQEATPAIPTPDEPKVTHLLMDTGFYNQLE